MLMVCGHFSVSDVIRDLQLKCDMCPGLSLVAGCVTNTEVTLGQPVKEVCVMSLYVFPGDTQPVCVLKHGTT